MIPFNSLGHSYKEDTQAPPIYLLDASDFGSFSIAGNNEVYNVINFGSAGGQYNVIGTPKYLNGGFESHSANDGFNVDLGSAFLPNKAFTLVVVIDLQNITSQLQIWSSIFADSDNNVYLLNSDTTETNLYKASSVFDNVTRPVTTGKKILIISFKDGIVNRIMSNGETPISTAKDFNNTNNASLEIMRYRQSSTHILGANNTIKEVRLYDYGMTPTQLTDLQDELTKKWGKMLYHVDASDTNSFTTDGSNNVLTLNNLGTEGGSFNVVGTPKYLNGGFESHSANDGFNVDLGSAFLPNKAFTLVVVIDLQNITGQTQLWGSIYGDYQNNTYAFNSSTSEYNQYKASGVTNPVTRPLTTGKKVQIISFKDGNVTRLMSNGDVVTTTSGNFNNTANATLEIMRYVPNTSHILGANNTIKEVRLYDYGMTNTQLTELQNQLNTKWQ